MTDSNQNLNPNTIKPNTNEENVDIFGGSYDIFENSDILEPIKDTLQGQEDETIEQEDNRAIEQEDNRAIEQEDNKAIEQEDEIIEQEGYETIEPNNYFGKTDDILETTEQENHSNIYENTTPQIEEPYFNKSFGEDIYDVDQSWNSDPIYSNSDMAENKVNNITNEDLLVNDIETPELENLDLDKSEDDNSFQNINQEDEDFFEKEDNLPLIENIETIEQEDETIEQEDDRTIEQEEDRTIEQEEDRTIEQEDEMIEQENDETTEQEDDEELDENEELEKEKQEAYEREIQVEVDQDKSDLQKKFYELIRETKNIHELVNKDLSEGFDLLGGNDDRKKTMYKIFVGDDFANIDRIETLKEDESQEVHTLSFVLEDSSLKINVDDELLYDELEDLIENPSKKMQVSEKLNKFIFLVTEEYKKIEKQKKEKEKRNMIKGIFRNF